MKKRVLFILLLLVFIVLISALYFFKSKPTSPQIELLTPKIEMPKKALIKDLSDIDIKEIIESVKDNEKIPKGLELPEYTPEQARPARHIFHAWMLEAEKIMDRDELSLKDLLNKETITILNGAYQRNASSRYLNVLVEQMLKAEDLTLEQYLLFADVLKIHRHAVASLSSEQFIRLIAKIKKILVEHSNTQNPLVAIQLLYLSYSLPMPSFQKDLLLQLKPLIVQATVSLKSDKFSVTADESTLLSKQAIDLAWAFHLDKMVIPEWLSLFIEKEACHLAYRLEQDGCLPVWQKEGERINLNEYIYKAAYFFDREDLRYIGLNGLRASKASPPEQLDFDFSDIGIFIVRTGWNHASTTNRYEPYQNEELQITYDRNLKMISMSIGVLTQFVFKVSTDINTMEELKNSFEFLLKKDGVVCTTCRGNITDYEVLVKNIDLLLRSSSSGYLIDGDTVRSYEFHWAYDGEVIMKSSFDVEIKRNDKKNIKSIIFNNKR